MRAMGIERFGGTEEIVRLHVDEPKVAPDSVLISVEAAGVNPVDWKIREGRLAAALPAFFPLVLGWDAAGTVERVGPAVTAFAPGDRVMAYCRKHTLSEGTYAELVSVPESFVAPVPDGVEAEQAAALPLAGLTARQCLDAAGVGEGATVLVHAAAGGVGHLACQLAVVRGARVIGTASAANHDFLGSLGVDEPLDYRDTDLAEAVREAHPDGVDAVLDSVGAHEQSLRMLREGGTLVSIAGPTDPAACAERGVAGAYVFVRQRGDQLAELGQLLGEGSLRVEIDEALELERAARAHERSEQGHVRGKLVLRAG